MKAYALEFDAPSWPNPAQLKLLQACLSDDATAAAAWWEWTQLQDFEQLDEGSQRLLPLLQHRIEVLGIKDRNSGRYRGFHRRTWVRNQRLLPGLADVLAGLNREGIETLVTKGAAVGPLFYKDAALRPMSDGDILVPFERADAAINWLLRHGWRALPARSFEQLRSFDRPKRHAWSFVNQDGVSVDLHWRLLSVAGGANEDQRFWCDAQPFEVRGVPTRTLSATHHLLHTCLHGVPWSRGASLRWVADAIGILRSGSSIDWAELVSAADAFRVSVLMAHSLEYLRRHVEAPVPVAVIDSLYSVPAETWQLAEFRAMTHDAPSLRRSYHLWHRHSRLRDTMAEWSNRSFVDSYLDFLRLHWEVNSAWQIPGEAFRRFVGLVARGGSG